MSFTGVLPSVTSTNTLCHASTLPPVMSASILPPVQFYMAINVLKSSSLKSVSTYPTLENKYKQINNLCSTFSEVHFCKFMLWNMYENLCNTYDFDKPCFNHKICRNWHLLCSLTLSTFLEEENILCKHGLKFFFQIIKIASTGALSRQLSDEQNEKKESHQKRFYQSQHLYIFPLKHFLSK